MPVAIKVFLCVFYCIIHLAKGRINARTQFHWNRHCERSAAIPLGEGTLLRERDRHVAALLAMAN